MMTRPWIAHPSPPQARLAGVHHRRLGIPALERRERPRRRAGALILIVATAATATFGAIASPAEPPPTSGPRFEDVAVAAGIDQHHAKPELDPALVNIMSWMTSVGAAAAAGDYNNDGWIDLYVTNSRKGTPNRLYRNDRDGTFTDVAAKAGVDNANNDGGVSMDCIWADFDNDGWSDLYIVRWGRDLLFRNNGDGTFTDETDKRLTTSRRRATPGPISSTTRRPTGRSRGGRAPRADDDTGWTLAVGSPTSTTTAGPICTARTISARTSCS